MADADWGCPCGAWVAFRNTVTLLHQVHGLTVHLQRCRGCAGQSLCTGNVYGAHGELYTPHDDDLYVPNRMTIDGVIFEPPNGDRFGYCSVCQQSMYWDVALQRWRDLTWNDVATEWEAVRA